MRNTLRTRITQSDGTLVLILFATIPVWMAGHWGDTHRWLCLLASLLAAYLVLEMNNRCHLMRERSRMMSTVFLLLVACMGFLHDDLRSCVLALSLSATNFSLLTAYQQRNPVWNAAAAFLSLGIGICLFPPLILAVPLLWFGCYHYVQIFSARVWRASIFGLAVPVLYAALYFVWKGSPLPNLEQTYLHWPHYEWPSLSIIVSVATLLVIALWSIAHFGRTSYKDNTRTRLSIQMLTMEFYFLFVLAALWPDKEGCLTAALIVCTAPVIGHYAALSESRFNNFLFWLFTFILLALLIFNNLELWPVLPTF